MIMRKLKGVVASTTFAIGILAVFSSASRAQTMDFSLTYMSATLGSPTVIINGMATANPGGGYLLTSISGTYGSEPILGLVPTAAPPGTPTNDGKFIYDNLVYAQAGKVTFDNNGSLFLIGPAGGPADAEVNIWTSDGGGVGAPGTNIVDGVYNFSSGYLPGTGGSATVISNVAAPGPIPGVGLLSYLMLGLSGLLLSARTMWWTVRGRVQASLRGLLRCLRPQRAYI